MKQKKNPRFRFSGSIDMEIIRRQVKRHRRSVLGQWTIRIVVAAMIVTGTYLVIENQTYTSVATADSHKKDTEDSNQYIAFSDGVIRYSRDGVVFLNKKNKEKWIQPCQIQNPIVDVNEDVFAIADVGGNTIMIFQKSGLKGEIETTLPIEKISVSNQGIVSAILKNESTPQIISYDAVGNILVADRQPAGRRLHPGDRHGGHGRSGSGLQRERRHRRCADRDCAESGEAGIHDRYRGPAAG